MFNHKGKNINLNDVKYMQNSCGVSIFEVKRLENGFYELVKDSKYNRRITAQTPISISGPAILCPALIHSRSLRQYLFQPA